MTEPVQLTIVNDSFLGENYRVVTNTGEEPLGIEKETDHVTIRYTDAVTLFNIIWDKSDIPESNEIYVKQDAGFSNYPDIVIHPEAGNSLLINPLAENEDCIAIQRNKTYPFITLYREDIPTVSIEGRMQMEPTGFIDAPFTSISDSGERGIKVPHIAIGSNGILQPPYTINVGHNNMVLTEYSSAFGENCIVAGNSAHAEGTNTKALYFYTHAEGKDTSAWGYASHAEGELTKTSSNNAHAEGYGTTASAEQSHAEGDTTTASGSASHAEGTHTTASGSFSHAEGSSSEASGDYSHAEAVSKANGMGSHSEGLRTDAVGEGSHAEGSNTSSIGKYSHAEGSSTHAIQEGSHSEGLGTFAYSNYSHAEGYMTKSGFSVNDFATHSEGNETTAYGISSHAEGKKTLTDAEAAHAEGNGTKAVSDFCHAEGEGTYAGMLFGPNANPTSCHAEGYQTLAAGSYSHAEGKYTGSYGVSSHAEGNQSYALGDHSHAEGASFTGYALNSDGAPWVPSPSPDPNEIIELESVNINLRGYYAHAEGNGCTAYADYSHAEGYQTEAYGHASHSEGYQCKVGSYDPDIPEGLVLANYGHAEGYKCQVLNQYGHAEGHECVASGPYSHAEGNQTTASGDSAHAEGSSSVASGASSHTEGYNTKASGIGAHAEGDTTNAQGPGSHAEGYACTAGERYCHAEGYGTQAVNFASHVQGKYNKPTARGGDITNTTGDAFIIGNGINKSTTGRSNAFKVTYAGDVYGVSAFQTFGADYAEFFEWKDGNPDAEDRIGHFVTMDGPYITYANRGNYILGIISGQPAVVGNSDIDWLGRWQHDEFGRFVWEYLEHSEEEIDTSEMTEDEKTTLLTDPEIAHHDDKYYRTITTVVDHETPSYRFKANPNYDPNTPYIERKDRPEWDYVGMMGVLSVYDNGACQVNGLCQCGDGGIAIPADIWQPGLTYRVIERMSENVIKVVFK